MVIEKRPDLQVVVKLQLRDLAATVAATASLLELLGVLVGQLGPVAHLLSKLFG
jgi:hypothetical protein